MMIAVLLCVALAIALAVFPDRDWRDIRYGPGLRATGSAPGGGGSPPTPPPPSLAWIQSKGQIFAAVSSAPVTFTTNVVSGDRICVGVATGNSGGTVTVTDGQGNSYTNRASQANGSAQIKGYLFETVATASGSLTVTVHSTAPEIEWVAISEYSGVASIGGTNASAATTSTMSVTVSDTSTADMIVALFIGAPGNLTFNGVPNYGAHVADFALGAGGSANFGDQSPTVNGVNTVSCACLAGPTNMAGLVMVLVA